MINGMKAEELREILEGLPCPFKTYSISDETLEEMLLDLEVEMRPWYDWEKDNTVTHDKVEEKWWETVESLANEYNIPYYEDPEE